MFEAVLAGAVAGYAIAIPAVPHASGPVGWSGIAGGDRRGTNRRATTPAWTFRLLAVAVAVVVVAAGAGLFMKLAPAVIGGPSSPPSIVPAPHAAAVGQSARRGYGGYSCYDPVVSRVEWLRPISAVQTDRHKTPNF